MQEPEVQEVKFKRPKIGVGILEVKIYEDEQLDDLQIRSFKIIQKKNGYKFGVDAVLLSDFAEVKKDECVIDLGTGTGVIPILIAGKTKARSITGVEIQKDIAEMAKRSVLLNNIENRVNIVCGDLRNFERDFKALKYDVVVSNPPYMNAGGGLINPLESKAVSRHEIMCTLEDVISLAAKIIKENGRFYLVHRPERLVDIIMLSRKYSLEPKCLKAVYPYKCKNANIILVKMVKGGNPMLKIVEPLYIYSEKGRYSEEINKIYGRSDNTVE